MAGIPYSYWRWARWATPALWALLLWFAPAARASTPDAPPFDLGVVRSRSLPWRHPLLVPEQKDPIPATRVSGTESWVEVEVTEHPFLEFTLEESNAAIALFGCDCPAHLNQLRRLRGLPLL